MSDDRAPAQADERAPGRPEVAPADDAYGLHLEDERAVIEALDAGDTETVRGLVLPMHYADVAGLLHRLDADKRTRLVQAIGDDLNPDTLSELDETVREQVIRELGFSTLAAAVHEMESDDAVHVVAHLDAETREQVLSALDAAERALIEQGLSYPEETAGRLMRRELVAVPAYWTVGETMDYLRTSRSLPEEFYNIFVVDPRHRPVGMIRLSRLVCAPRRERLEAIADTDMTLIPASMNQEEVAFLFRRHNLLSAAVVDSAGRLLGTVTVDDVVDVIDEEAEDDLMRLGGVAESDLYTPILRTARSRLTWMVVNLGTAILASLVIALFQDTLDQIVALAVLMPIVASMGGNAGIQTLTVAVRAIATRELSPTNAWRLLGKEGLVGGLNGLALAAVTGVVAWLWFGDWALGGVIALAMILTLIVAGLSGAAIPLALERLRIDPAVASGIFLTTITDVVGFFTFLGIAGLLLL